MHRYLIASLIAPMAAVPVLLVIGFVDYWLLKESSFESYLFGTIYLSLFVLAIIYPISLVLMNLAAYCITRYSEFTYRIAFLSGLVVSSLLAVSFLQSLPMLFIRIVVVGTAVTLCYWYVWNRLHSRYGG